MKTKTVITTTIISEDVDDKEMFNWKAIVSHLHRSDSLINIARKAHCDERTLSNIKKGVTIEPKFSTGIQLLALHGLKFPELHEYMGLS